MKHAFSPAMRHAIRPRRRPVLPTPLTGIMYDTFVAANETALASRVPPVRPNANVWVQGGGSFVINNNRLEGRFGASGNAHAHFDVGQANIDLRVQGILPATAANRAFGIICRYVDSQNYFTVVANGDLQVFRILELTANVQTQRATANVTLTAGTTYTLRVTLVGDVITAWLNGANELTYTTSVRNTATKHGIRAINTVAAPAIILDSFQMISVAQPADVTVTISATPLAVSIMEPALTWVDNPNTWRQAGWANVLANMQGVVGAQSTHGDPFGNGVIHEDADGAGISGVPNNLYGETVPGPSTRNPSNPATNSYVYGLQKMREISATGPLHVKLFAAGLWFAKHEVVNSGGSYAYTNLVYADRFSSTKGRPKYTHIADWKAAMKGMAKVAMASPYNVRYFSVWNELKGFWDPVLGKWDMSYNTLPLGYSRFYKEMVDAVLEGATELGVAHNTLNFGGPYAVLRGRGTNTNTVSGSHPYASVLNGRSWGWTEKHGINALDDFLTQVQAQGLRLDFLTMDGADLNKDSTGYPAADDWINGQRYRDWHTYFRGALGDKGQDDTMPIVWDEIYRWPAKAGSGGTALRAALHADFYCDCMLDGVSWPMLWGPEWNEVEGSDQGGMVSDPATAGGGQRLPFGDHCEMFVTHWPPGTQLYTVTNSNSTSLRVIGGATKAILGNKTASPLTVSLDGDLHTVDGYEYKTVNR